MSMHPAVIWDLGGKLRATVFASRREAFTMSSPGDQTSQLVVLFGTSDQFDPARDYLVRVVTKGSLVENQLLVGTLPSWAGGDLSGVGRVMIATPERAEVFERVAPVSLTHQIEWMERGIPVPTK